MAGLSTELFCLCDGIYGTVGICLAAGWLLATVRSSAEVITILKAESIVRLDFIDPTTYLLFLIFFFIINYAFTFSLSLSLSPLFSSFLLFSLPTCSLLTVKVASRGILLAIRQGTAHTTPRDASLVSLNLRKHTHMFGCTFARFFHAAAPHPVRN